MTTTIELVRHTKAHSRDRWWGKSDHTRPLTDAGFEQSRALARELVKGVPIDALYSSAFLRCVQTLEPLAERLGLDVEEEDALGEAANLPVLDGGDPWVAAAWLGGRAVGLVNRLVHDHPDGRVIACSHGDVIPALLAVLVGRDRLELSDVRVKKGARMTLIFDGVRCVAAEACPPPT